MTSDIALVVTAIGVLGVVIGLRQSYRERLRQFEARYVERYWKILDQLSLKAVHDSVLSKVSESDEKGIRSYISLCEDELEMRHYGYIADSTYELWGEGIRSQLRQHYFGSVWKEVKDEIDARSASQYMYLRTIMSTDPVKALEAGDINDPLKMGQFHRTLRGLRGLNGV